MIIFIHSFDSISQALFNSENNQKPTAENNIISELAVSIQLRKAILLREHP
jgi:hypothetical protein